MLMRQPLPELQFAYKLPFGAVVNERGVQFVVFSRSATAMRLLLYKESKIANPLRSSSLIEKQIDGVTFGASLFPALGRDNSITSRQMVLLIQIRVNGLTAMRG